MQETFRRVATAAHEEHSAKSIPHHLVFAWRASPENNIDGDRPCVAAQARRAAYPGPPRLPRDRRGVRLARGLPHLEARPPSAPFDVVAL